MVGGRGRADDVVRALPAHDRLEPEPEPRHELARIRHRDLRRAVERRLPGELGGVELAERADDELASIGDQDCSDVFAFVRVTKGEAVGVHDASDPSGDFDGHRLLRRLVRSPEAELEALELGATQDLLREPIFRAEDRRLDRVRPRQLHRPEMRLDARLVGSAHEGVELPLGSAPRSCILSVELELDDEDRLGFRFFFFQNNLPVAGAPYRKFAKTSIHRVREPCPVFRPQILGAGFWRDPDRHENVGREFEI